MSADTSEPALGAAVRAANDGDDPTRWLVAAYASPTSTAIVLVDSGRDPALPAVRARVDAPANANGASFAFATVAGRGLVVLRIGDGIGGVRRAKAVLHSRTFAALFPDYLALATLTRPGELTDAFVADRLGISQDTLASSSSVERVADAAAEAPATAPGPPAAEQRSEPGSKPPSAARASATSPVSPSAVRASSSTPGPPSTPTAPPAGDSARPLVAPTPPSLAPAPPLAPAENGSAPWRAAARGIPTPTPAAVAETRSPPGPASPPSRIPLPVSTAPSPTRRARASSTRTAPSEPDTDEPIPIPASPVAERRPRASSSAASVTPADSQPPRSPTTSLSSRPSSSPHASSPTSRFGPDALPAFTSHPPTFTQPRYTFGIGSGYGRTLADHDLPDLPTPEVSDAESDSLAPVTARVFQRSPAKAPPAAASTSPTKPLTRVLGSAAPGPPTPPSVIGSASIDQRGVIPTPGMPATATAPKAPTSGDSTPRPVRGAIAEAMSVRSRIDSWATLATATSATATPTTRLTPTPSARGPSPAATSVALPPSPVPPPSPAPPSSAPPPVDHGLEPPASAPMPIPSRGPDSVPPTSYVHERRKSSHSRRDSDSSSMPPSSTYSPSVDGSPMMRRAGNLSTSPMTAPLPVGRFTPNPPPPPTRIPSAPASVHSTPPMGSTASFAYYGNNTAPYVPSHQTQASYSSHYSYASHQRSPSRSSPGPSPRPSPRHSPRQSPRKRSIQLSNDAPPLPALPPLQPVHVPPMPPPPVVPQVPAVPQVPQLPPVPAMPTVPNMNSGYRPISPMPPPVRAASADPPAPAKSTGWGPFRKALTPTQPAVPPHAKHIIPGLPFHRSEQNKARDAPVLRTRPSHEGLVFASKSRERAHQRAVAAATAAAEKTERAQAQDYSLSRATSEGSSLSRQSETQKWPGEPPQAKPDPRQNHQQHPYLEQLHSPTPERAPHLCRPSLSSGDMVPEQPRPFNMSGMPGGGIGLGLGPFDQLPPPRDSISTPDPLSPVLAHVPERTSSRQAMSDESRDGRVSLASSRPSFANESRTSYDSAHTSLRSLMQDDGDYERAYGGMRRELAPPTASANALGKMSPVLPPFSPSAPLPAAAVEPDAASVSLSESPISNTAFVRGPRALLPPPSPAPDIPLPPLPPAPVSGSLEGYRGREHHIAVLGHGRGHNREPTEYDIDKILADVQGPAELEPFAPSLDPVSETAVMGAPALEPLPPLPQPAMPAGVQASPLVVVPEEPAEEQGPRRLPVIPAVAAEPETAPAAPRATPFELDLRTTPRPPRPMPSPSPLSLHSLHPPSPQKSSLSNMRRGSLPSSIRSVSSNSDATTSFATAATTTHHTDDFLLSPCPSPLSPGGTPRIVGAWVPSRSSLAPLDDDNRSMHSSLSAPPTPPFAASPLTAHPSPLPEHMDLTELMGAVTSGVRTMSVGRPAAARVVNLSALNTSSRSISSSSAAHTIESWAPTTDSPRESEDLVTTDRKVSLSTQGSEAKYEGLGTPNALPKLAHSQPSTTAQAPSQPSEEPAARLVNGSGAGNPQTTPTPYTHSSKAPTNESVPTRPSSPSISSPLSRTSPSRSMSTAPTSPPLGKTTDEDAPSSGPKVSDLSGHDDPTSPTSLTSPTSPLSPTSPRKRRPLSRHSRPSSRYSAEHASPLPSPAATSTTITGVAPALERGGSSKTKMFLFRSPKVAGASGELGSQEDTSAAAQQRLRTASLTRALRLRRGSAAATTAPPSLTSLANGKEDGAVGLGLGKLFGGSGSGYRTATGGIGYTPPAAMRARPSQSEVNVSAEAALYGARQRELADQTDALERWRRGEEQRARQRANSSSNTTPRAPPAQTLPAHLIADSAVDPISSIVSIGKHDEELQREPNQVGEQASSPDHDPPRHDAHRVYEPEPPLDYDAQAEPRERLVSSSTMDTEDDGSDDSPHSLSLAVVQSRSSQRVVSSVPQLTLAATAARDHRRNRSASINESVDGRIELQEAPESDSSPRPPPAELLTRSAATGEFGLIEVITAAERARGDAPVSPSTLSSLGSFSAALDGASPVDPVLEQRPEIQRFQRAWEEDTERVREERLKLEEPDRGEMAERQDPVRREQERLVAERQPDTVRRETKGKRLELARLEVERRLFEAERRAEADRLAAEEREVARVEAEERAAAEQRRVEMAAAKRRRAEELESERVRREEAARVAREQRETAQRAREEEEKRLSATVRERLKTGMADGGVMLRGWVTVQTMSSLTWRRRYFHLTATAMQMYKSDADSGGDAAGAKPLVVAPLSGAAVSETYEESQVRGSWKLRDGHGEEYYMFADTPEDKGLILESLRLAIG